MNFFDCTKAIVKRAHNGGYTVSLITNGIVRSAAFSDYEAFSQWLGEQAREFELKRDNPLYATTGTVTWTMPSGVPVTGGERFDIKDCQFNLTPATPATDETPPYPNIPLPPDAQWCRDPAGGWVLVDVRRHIHATHDWPTSPVRHYVPDGTGWETDGNGNWVRVKPL